MSKHPVVFHHNSIRQQVVMQRSIFSVIGFIAVSRRVMEACYLDPVVNERGEDKVCKPWTLGSLFVQTRSRCSAGRPVCGEQSHTWSTSTPIWNEDTLQHTVSVHHCNYRIHHWKLRNEIRRKESQFVYLKKHQILLQVQKMSNIFEKISFLNVWNTFVVSFFHLVKCASCSLSALCPSCYLLRYYL